MAKKLATKKVKINLEDLEDQIITLKSDVTRLSEELKTAKSKLKIAQQQAYGESYEEEKTKGGSYKDLTLKSRDLSYFIQEAPTVTNEEETV